MEGKSLIDTTSLDSSKFNYLLSRASELKKAGKLNANQTLAGRELGLLFYEPSTRTHLSFALAGKRLGMSVFSFDSMTSSEEKGESREQTAFVFQSMGIDILVVRCSEYQFIQSLARNLNIPVINAGSGIEEHPTQALIDAFTLQENIQNEEGCRVLFIGDVFHSRVARSSLFLLSQFGYQVAFYDTRGEKIDGFSAFEDFQEAIDWVSSIPAKKSAVYLLRNQKEKWNSDVNSAAFSWENVGKILTENTFILHSGPLDDAQLHFLNFPRSLIYQQVENSIWMRMAILEYFLSES